MIIQRLPVLNSDKKHKTINIFKRSFIPADEVLPPVLLEVRSFKLYT